MRRSSILLLLVVAALVTWTLYSYWSAGLVFVLLNGSPGDGPWLDRVRATVAGWGRWAPIVYTLAVVAEVIVAPIPGTLLYAPAGAIFGGFVGGTLSLVGNVIGAAVCCVLGRLIGDRMLAVRVDESQLAKFRALLERRGVWLVLLLRLNPLTTSDLVSYGAGVAGVPPWKVALGTLLGLAPWCYAQAYFAERVFEVVPGRLLILSGVLLLALLAAVLVLRRGREVRGGDTQSGHSTVTVTRDTQP